MKNSSKGGAGVWFLVVLLIAGLWVGYRVALLYLDHAAIEKEVKTHAMNALVSGRDDNLRDRIAKTLEEYRVRYDPENISIRIGRDGSRMFVRVSYMRELDLIATQHWMNFKVDVIQDAPHQAGKIHDIQQQVQDSYQQGEERYQEGLDNALGN